MYDEMIKSFEHNNKYVLLLPSKLFNIFHSYYALMKARMRRSHPDLNHALINQNYQGIILSSWFEQSPVLVSVMRWHIHPSRIIAAFHNHIFLLCPHWIKIYKISSCFLSYHDNSDLSRSHPNLIIPQLFCCGKFQPTPLISS